MFYLATQSSSKTWICGKCRERKETLSLKWCRIGSSGAERRVAFLHDRYFYDEVEDRTRTHLINCKQFRDPELASPYLILHSVVVHFLDHSDILLLNSDSSSQL